MLRFYGAYGFTRLTVFMALRDFRINIFPKETVLKLKIYNLKQCVSGKSGIEI